MRSLVPSGVWEIFIPNLPMATLQVRGPHVGGPSAREGRSLRAFFEVPPQDASIVWTRRLSSGATRVDGRSPGRHGWHDRPMSIYEVHLGSWRRVPEEGDRRLTYRELAETLVPYVREMGYTHIELMPVMEHPVLGLVGLSGHRLLRADQPVRDARRLPAISSTSAIATASA